MADLARGGQSFTYVHAISFVSNDANACKNRWMDETQKAAELMLFFFSETNRLQW